MKRYRPFFESENLYHATQSDLRVGTVYSPKLNRGTFGDFEKLLEKYRPNNAVSRLNCFYTSNKMGFVKDFGSNIYTVKSVGKYTSCGLGWVTILQDFCSDKGYIEGFSKRGYLLGKIKKEDVPFIEEIVQNYFTNKRITPKDLIGIHKTTEIGVVETLCSKIKIIKQVR